MDQIKHYVHIEAIDNLNYNTVPTIFTLNIYMNKLTKMSYRVVIVVTSSATRKTIKANIIVM